MPLDEKEIVLIILYVSLFFTAMAVLFIIFYSYSRRKLLQKEIEQHELEIKHQKNMLQSVITAQENERRRIARDLHDDISSKLNAIYLNTSLLKLPGFNETRQSGIVAAIITITEKAIENSGRIAHALLPATLEKIGLDAAIKELCSEYSTLENVAIQYNAAVSFDGLESSQALHIFRILQELISNSLRHGKAKMVTINFKADEISSYCEYTDNGCGFKPDSSRPRAGLGMANIYNRVEMLKGKLVYNSETGKGVNVKFTF